MKFKVGDEILIRGKITTTNCEELHKGHYALTSACVYVDDNFDLHISGDWLNNHATLIDPNEPVNGQRVWLIDDDGQKRYYVGKGKFGRIILEREVNDEMMIAYYEQGDISTKDPYAKENKPLLIHNGIEWSEDTIKSMIDKHTK